MVYILYLKDPASFLIWYILIFIKVSTGDLQNLRQMTYQCNTVPPSFCWIIFESISRIFYVDKLIFMALLVQIKTNLVWKKFNIFKACAIFRQSIPKSKKLKSKQT